MATDQKWVRKRVTEPMTRKEDSRRVRFLLGERTDGSVFFQSMYYHGEKGRDLYEYENAEHALNFFLYEPLVPSSVGTFDTEPNMYIPGMSPARI